MPDLEAIVQWVSPGKPSHSDGWHPPSIIHPTYGNNLTSSTQPSIIGSPTLSTSDESESLMLPAEPVAATGVSSRNSAPELTLPVALATVAGCTLVMGIAGAGVGLALGMLAPAYYRGVFRNGDEPWFDPPSVGLGLGLSQGLILGALLGVAIVALFIARDTQRIRAFGSTHRPIE